MIDSKTLVLHNNFLAGFEPHHEALIRNHLAEVEFNAGEVLFKEREPANRLYVIESGQIAIEAAKRDGEAIIIETVGAGDVIGWSWLYPPFVWHFGARALEPSKALVVNGATLLSLATRDHEFGYTLMKRLAQIVIHRLEQTRDRLLQTNPPCLSR